MTWLTDDNAECRRIGHAWEDIKWYSLGEGYTANVLRCTRCTTVRNDLYDIIGELAKRNYQYPSGYSKPRDEDRPTMPELRLFRLKSRRPQKKVTSGAVRAMWARMGSDE